MASIKNHFHGLAFKQEDSMSRQTGRGHHTVGSIDSIQLNIDEYAAHEQAEMQAWLISSQDNANGLLSATIDAVRRQGYCTAGFICDPLDTAHSSSVSNDASNVQQMAKDQNSPEILNVPQCNLHAKPSLIPLPKSYRSSPLGTPRGSRSSASCMPSPCTMPCPSSSGNLHAAFSSAALDLMPTSTERRSQGDDNNGQSLLQAFEIRSENQETSNHEQVIPSAPRFSVNDEIPIIASHTDADCYEDIDHDCKTKQGCKLSSWTSGIVAGAAAVQMLSPGTQHVASQNESKQDLLDEENTKDEEFVDLSVLVQASGDSFLKGLRESGLLPNSMTSDGCSGLSRQGSWPKLGFVDNSEQMDNEILSGTLGLPSGERASTYFQSNTLFGGPPVSPRQDNEDNGSQMYRPPAHYACAYGSTFSSQVEDNPKGGKGFFEGLFSNMQMLVMGGSGRSSEGTNDSRLKELHTKFHEQVPRKNTICSESFGSELAQNGHDSAATAPDTLPATAKFEPPSPCRTLTEYSGDSLNAEAAEEDNLPPLSPGRFAMYGAVGYGESPRECSVSNIYPPNSARSEYYAYRRGSWTQGNDTMPMDGDDGDVDGEQLSAQLQNLLSSSVSMCKESGTAEEQQSGSTLQADASAEIITTNDSWRPALQTAVVSGAPSRYSAESPRTRIGHEASFKHIIQENEFGSVNTSNQGQKQHQMLSSVIGMQRSLARRETGSTDRDDTRSEKTESTVVVRDSGVSSAEELRHAVLVGTHRKTESSGSQCQKTAGGGSNSGRTLSLVDMVEVQHQQSGNAISPDVSDIKSAAAIVSGDPEKSEAERLGVLKEELGRVLTLLMSRPSEDQDKAQISKLLDLQITIEGVQNEMQATESKARDNKTSQQSVKLQLPANPAPVDEAVTVSIDFTQEGPAFCVLDSGLAGKTLPMVMPADHDRASARKTQTNMLPQMARKIKSLFTSHDHHQLGCFGRILSCAHQPQADMQQKSQPSQN